MIRIVGPSFDLVSGWAQDGVPFKIACAGIDRYFERSDRRRPRRRPVRIEFCGADVLDAFDHWKKSVGVARVATGDRDESASWSDSPALSRRGPSLAGHLEQVVARLTVRRATSTLAQPAAEILDRAVRAIDALQSRAKRARGEARDGVISELAGLEDEVLTDLTATLMPAERAALEVEAEQELAAFRARMPADAFARARHAAFTRLVRDRFVLPQIRYD
ncbi:MAG: hypothetical protein ABR606_18365 [Vicinamibacterales bacterium]